MRIVMASRKMVSIAAALEIALASGGCAASGVTETSSLTEKADREQNGQGIGESVQAAARPTRPPGMTKLTGARLTRLVAGAMIIRPPNEAPGVTEVPAHGGEAFLPNGAYSIVVDRARISGNYKTDKDVLCVYVIGTPARCRHIYTDMTGKFFQEWLSRRGVFFEIKVVK